ncbi:MAG: NnrS family protein, partial [Thiogranum sp.]|nr:NnrS family protein [Thiogranum sp.]
AGTAPLLPAAALLDLLFGAGLIAAIAAPIVRARQWGNLAIVAKVLLLVASNLVFYLGVAGELQQGVFLGLYSGLYLVLALVLTMSRRVLPFFIERGVDRPVQLRNSKWIDITSLVLFLGFWIADLARPNGLQVTLLAIALAVLHAVRLWGWHTAGLWRKPLLWSLYLAYASIIAGFVLKASVYYGNLSPYLAVHAFAVGGIGLMTLGMMARVALGHTGRNVFEPPPVLFWVLAALIAALVARVLLPLVVSEQYRLWVMLSQGLWVLAFLAFVVIYVPILTRPRVDGKDG